MFAPCGHKNKSTLASAFVFGMPDAIRTHAAALSRYAGGISVAQDWNLRQQMPDKRKTRRVLLLGVRMYVSNPFSE